jgi:hypothetical protein
MRSRYGRAIFGAGCGVVLFALLSPAASAQGTVSTVAGTGRPAHGGDGGPAARAGLSAPSGIAVDAGGDIAVADTGNCRIQVIAAHAGRHFGVAMKAKHVYTVAGTTCRRPGSKTSSTALVDPTGVVFDPAGDLLIADGNGNRVFDLPVATGRAFGVAVKADHLSSIQGNGLAPGIGPKVRGGRLDNPEGIAIDGAGNLYFTDTARCAVYEMYAHSGTDAGDPVAGGGLRVVAGTQRCGFSGDGGPADTAELWSPSAVAVDKAGDVLIADEGNSAVREVAATSGTFYGVPIAAGDIATVAGQDTFSAYLADGLAATGDVADINYPTGLALDGAGDLFIADSVERAIREVPARDGTLLGQTVTANDMYTVAGILTVGGSVPLGDGTRWIRTHVTDPWGVAVGADGSLIFSDQGANTVRRIAGS